MRFVRFSVGEFFLVGFMQYLRDLQVLFFSKNNFKIGSHGTIHISKNYFVIVFSVFNFQQ